MNPPPLPPSPTSPPGQKSFARQAALLSLLMAITTLVLMGGFWAVGQVAEIPLRMKFAAIALLGLLLVGGFVLAIIGLSEVRQDGAKRLLGLSLAGLAGNGLLLAVCGVAFASGVSQGIRSRQASQDLQKTTREVQANVRKSFDPERGLTNSGAADADRLQKQLRKAAQSLSGDDAIIAEAMARHLSRMKTAAELYEGALNELKKAEVLRTDNLTNKQQLVTRREVVARFASANESLRKTIRTSEDCVRADLVELRHSPARLSATLAQFHQKAAPRNVLTLQIRACDDRLGEAMTGMLNILDTQWGRWAYNGSAQQLQFESNAARQAYNNYFEEIQSASADQIAAQRKLVNLPP